MMRIPQLRIPQLRIPPALGRLSRLSLVLGGLSLAAAEARAQGTLADQGFGYPPGQLSTRALGTAGALGENDPVSPINPAALGDWGRGGLFFQYAPEFTQVTVGGNTDRTTSTRFPLVAAAVHLGTHYTLGLASSTFLARNFTTASTVEQTLPSGRVVNTTTTLSSTGAANDVRLGLARVISRVSLGVGLHAFTGQNRVSVSGTFVDPTDTSLVNPFLQLSQARTLSFSGVGVSAGVQWRPARPILLAFSGRHGGTLRLSAVDTLVRKAQIPDRLGGAVIFDGIPGTTLSARVSWEQWSSLDGLLSPDVKANDATEYSAGADVRGPRLMGRAMMLRLGGRRRTLPFTAEGAKVDETSFAGGFGLPLSGERAVMDFSALRASRSASGVGASELAWTIALGFTVRP
jgi:hypothetical protein